MTFRRISIGAIAALALLNSAMGPDTAVAAPDAPQASFRPGANVSHADTLLPAYRQYVKEQADTLVGMTRVMAREVKDGNLEAAQAVYGPAHRYLARIEPVVKLLHDLDARIDARAGAYEGKEADPKFSGFHRVEYGIFAKRSTAGLSAEADRLNEDARALRERIAHLDLTQGVLVGSAAKLAEEMAERKLDGAEELYSKTDLWDLEANVEGVRQIVAMVEAQRPARHAPALAQTSLAFAKIAAVLERNKDGCGFKNFSEVAADDKAALEAAVAALAGSVSTMRGPLAMD